MNSGESKVPDKTISLEISKDRFELASHELRGRRFGAVMLATLKPGAGGRGSEAPVEAVARRIQVNNTKTESKAVASWLDRQTRVWAACSHENILKFIGYCTENDFMTVYLFSPYMRNGNAKTYLEKKQSTMEERFLLIRDTLMGLDYLHNFSPPVVHGNLRAVNVLISNNGRAVLSDVGLYTLVNSVELIGGVSLDTVVGRAGPESVSTSDRTTKNDIWGWGCLALEMMTGNIPYHPDNVITTKVRLGRGETPEPRPPPQDWPTGLLELVRRCWSINPENRPNVRTCVESVNITVSLIERLRKEVLEISGSAFITRERLQPGPNQTLRAAGNCVTRKVGLSPSGALVVVKEINLRKVHSTSSRADYFKRFAQQMAILSSCKHGNIIELIGYSATYDFETVSLVTPYMVNGNLADTIHKVVDMKAKLELARDTMNGLQYLHSMELPVVHGNLTPFNVLITETGKAVLSDVGLAAIDRHLIATTPWASVRWYSPEFNLGDPATRQSDIWSWACVVLQLATGDPPYSAIQTEDHVKAVISFGECGLLTPEAFHELDEIPDVLLQLLRKCWEFDPSQRPSARECMETLNSTLSADPDRKETEAHSDTKRQRSPDDASPPKQLGNGGAGSDGQVIPRFEKEIDRGRTLKHPYALRFVGTRDHEAHLFFVNPFAENGTVWEYVSDRPGINRVRLLCETSDAEPKQTLRTARHRTTTRAKLRPLGALVVVKEIDLHKIGSLSSRIDFIKRFNLHVAALWSLKHENIVEFIGYSVATGFETVSLVTHHMANGNLMDYVRKEFNMNRRLELARDITNGLQYLHNREPQVVHGNLNPFNVLVSETGEAVLDDYHVEAIDIHHPSATNPGAHVRWSSPEVNQGGSAVIESDMWSWACVFLQLLTGDLPYSSIQSDEHIKLIKGGILTPEAFHKLDKIPDILVQLLQRCWKFDLSDRPNARECMDTLNSMLSADSDARSTRIATLSLDDDVSRFITSVSPQAICINGRFGDVFKGTHKTMGEVALKRLRIGGAAPDEQVIRRFEREANTWRRLEHPHVLKFLGTYKPEGHLYFVSPFMQNGTLLEYVNDYPGVNRVKLLYETSDAIAYLHREDIVHGDIKGGNLLINDHGSVLLCDFGLTKPTYAQTSTALKGAGSVRWQSPELWDNEPRTFASDVYAFSMTIVEVLTGLPPFPHLQNEMAVLMAVGQRDERPVKIPLESSNGVSYKNTWTVAEACWPKILGDRMSISEASRLLKADPSLV